MDLLKLRQALQCHLGNAVLKCVLPEALDETKVTTPRALAEYLRLPEVSCAPRVPSAEQGRQMRELVEVRAKLVDFESILARGHNSPSPKHRNVRCRSIFSSM